MESSPVTYAYQVLREYLTNEEWIYPWINQWLSG